MSLLNDLTHDPLLKRFVREVVEPAQRRGGGILPPITQPWQVFAEQRMFAFNLLSNTGAISDLKSESAAVLLLSAPPFLWREEMYLTAMASPLPRHTVRPSLPFPVMWWTFEKYLDFAAIGGEYNMAVDALLLAEHTEQQQGMMVFLFGTGQGNFRVQAVHIPYGIAYPNDVPSSTHIAHTVLRLLAFLSSKYVVTERKRLSRQEIRHEFVDYAGVLPDPPAPEICIINLRTPVYPDAGRKPPREEDGTAPVWSHRWLVRGHYRNQWYPSEEGHKVIWVPSYVKGPADKPFHAPLYHVKQ